MTMPVLLLLVAALADAYTSHRLFKRGGVERNLIVIKLFGKRPTFGAMLAVKAAAFGVIAYFGTDAMHLAGAAAWAAAAVWNATR